jgi:hypothetical protein
MEQDRYYQIVAETELDNIRMIYNVREMKWITVEGHDGTGTSFDTREEAEGYFPIHDTEGLKNISVEEVEVW